MTKPDAETRSAQDELAAQVAQLRADVASIAETLAALGQAKAKAAMGDEASAMMQARLAEATEFARKNPTQAMAMAGGLGLMLGLLFGRR